MAINAFPSLKLQDLLELCWCKSSLSNVAAIRRNSSQPLLALIYYNLNKLLLNFTNLMKVNDVHICKMSVDWLIETVLQNGLQTADISCCY